MKIILRKDYEFLGGIGEIFEVKDGYARNFLIPNGIAIVATDSNVKSINEIKKQQGRKIEKQIEDAQSLAKVIENTPVNIEMKTGEDDKIYGSVTSQMIYDKLIESGVPEFDKRKIVLKEVIKTLGEHEVEIKLLSSVSAPLKVIVYREGGSADEFNQQPEAEVNVEAEVKAEEEVKVEAETETPAEETPEVPVEVEEKAEAEQTSETRTEEEVKE